jgi:predicted Zn-dependent peptidase
MNYKSHQLSNGLGVVLAPLKSTETVTVLFLVATGSKYETKEENGISHFLEHMFFKGTSMRPDTLAISEALDNVGGIYNAFTGKEYTGFYVKLAHLHLPLALDVLSDMLTNSLFKEEEIEREKGVISEEIKLYQDTPIAYVDEVFEELLYGDTPAGWHIIGTEKNITQLKRENFVNYLKNHYSTKNSVLVIAGKIDPDDTLKLTEKFFGSYPTQETKDKIKVIEKQEKPEIVVFPKATDQTHLCLGARSFDMFSKKRHALALLDTVLGGGMSSRLFINIRERQGLCYYIKSSQESYTDSGYFVVQAGIHHENIQKVVKLIKDEFTRIKQDLVSEQELKKAKEHIKGTTLLALETSSDIAFFLGRQKLLRNKISSPEKIFQKIDKITSKDIRSLAQEIFVPKNLNLALITPNKNQSLKNTLIF